MDARILVLSASVDAGHLRGAEAVETALRRLDPGATVLDLDVLEMTNATFHRLCGRAHLDLVDVAPHVPGDFHASLACGITLESTASGCGRGSTARGGVRQLRVALELDTTKSET